MAAAAPGWQTEELQDEWPDLGPGSEDDADDHNLSYGTQSLSLTIPLSSQIHSVADFQPNSTPLTNTSYAVGTFVVREDVPGVPLLPKTPGRNKNFIKDFFTPLPLERMFEPPSPPSPETPSEDANSLSGSVQAQTPAQSGRVDDEIIETDMPNMNSFHGRKAGMACQFTFSVPRKPSSQRESHHTGVFPQAQSTPNPPVPPTQQAPATDSRLRLFQFQYDTYTREHLSALVDSIAVNNTPSGTGTGTTPTPTSLSYAISHVPGGPSLNAHFRSSKRIKLSPSEDFQEDAAAAKLTVARPIIRKDYVGESQSLMQQIKLAKDYSTISTVASGQNNSPSISHDTPDRFDGSVKLKTPSGECFAPS